MFFRLLIFAAAIFFVVWVVKTFIAPFFAADAPKESSKTKEEKSLLDEYSEAEIYYRTKQNELSSKSEEQIKKAQQLEAEAQTIQEQIKNKSKNK